MGGWGIVWDIVRGGEGGGYTMGVHHLHTKFSMINIPLRTYFVSNLNYIPSLLFLAVCQPVLVGLDFEGKLKHVTVCSRGRGQLPPPPPLLLEVPTAPPPHPHPPTPPPPGGQWTNRWAMEAAQAWRNIQSWSILALCISDIRNSQGPYLCGYVSWFC